MSVACPFLFVYCFPGLAGVALPWARYCSRDPVQTTSIPFPGASLWLPADHGKQRVVTSQGWPPTFLQWATYLPSVLAFLLQDQRGGSVPEPAKLLLGRLTGSDRA